MENNPFFTGSSGARQMEINGLSCELHMPAAIKSERDALGNEKEFDLPPYGLRNAFSVDENDAACPPDWMRGSADAASYFVPVKDKHGLWLNLNGCSSHTHHVAALISIQGVNAVTGQKQDKLRLEQYAENCLVHNVKFGAERLCKECNFKWPHQNYLATTGTPDGKFWLDGFRAKDGVIRQFVFTTETMRGVAAQIIGEERVFALGVSFFLSKEPKPPVYHSRPRGMYLGGGGGLESYGGGRKSFGAVPCHAGPFRGATRSLGAAPRVKSAPAMEIAAGARVKQHVHRDPQEPGFWQDKPAGILYINYCSEEQAEAILRAGQPERSRRDEGFMGGLKVGHPGHDKA